MSAAQTEDLFDLALSSGRVRARRIGAANAPLTLLVHGLSAHLHGLDYVGQRLAAPDRQLVAIDLRGRGRSEVTARGTYGIAAHARDVLEIAARLGADRFDLVGWSMGALIGIVAAGRAPERIGRLVLIDHAGAMDEAALDKIIKGLARLDAVVADKADYVAAVRAAAGLSPWTTFWDRYFEYELVPHENGFKPTTSRAACLEDLADIVRQNWPELWKGVQAKTLLLRCLNPMAGGFILPEAVRDEVMRTIPGIRLVEDASDHYTIMTSEPAAEAMRAFLWE